MPLAIFDLDDTLIAGDSDHAWGQFLVSKHLVDEETFKAQNDRFFQQYRQGVLDVDAYLAFSCAPLAQIQPETLVQLQDEFMTTVIAPMILPRALNCIAKHREQGDFVMIITATLDAITQPIARALGVETLLAPVAEVIEGRYTGSIKGIATLGQGKVDRLHLWLKDEPYDLTGSTFYSDSRNDIPLLSVVDHPICVDPDPVLRAHAATKNWPIISLR
ncbi:MAG: HAD family hydrolase [Pseudomonadales bacterium]